MPLHPFIHLPKESKFVLESRVRPLSFDWKFERDCKLSSMQWASSRIQRCLPSNDLELEAAATALRSGQPATKIRSTVTG
jgi:hypothetical protein